MITKCFRNAACDVLGLAFLATGTALAGIPSLAGSPSAGAVQPIYFATVNDGNLIATAPNADGSVIVETDKGVNNAGQILLLTPPTSGTIYTAATLKVFDASQVDGGHPNGALVKDSAGNVWGMTNYSAAHSQGTVFELVNNGGGSWTFRTAVVLTDDAGLISSALGYGGLVFDSHGNLVGISAYTAGGACADEGCGTVFTIPAGVLGGAGTRRSRGKILYNFTDGHIPVGLVRDRHGDLFGIETHGGDVQRGAVWEVSPPTSSGAAWTEQLIYKFCEVINNGCPDGYLPEGTPALDTAGNIYGTTSAGGDGATYAADGTVWKLTRSGSSFTFQSLHTFNDQGCNTYHDNKVATPVRSTLISSDSRILTFVPAGGTVRVCTPQEADYNGALVALVRANGNDQVLHSGWGSVGHFSGPIGIGSDPTQLGTTVFGTSTGYYDHPTNQNQPPVVFSITR